MPGSETLLSEADRLIYTDKLTAMAEPLSTGGKLGRAAGQLFNAARHAGKPALRTSAAAAGRSLTFSGIATSAPVKLGAGKRLVRQFTAHIALTLRLLGYQLGGILFLAFALAFGWHGLTVWRHLPPRIGLAGERMAFLQMGIGLLFAYFGLSSWFKSAALRRNVK